MAEEEVATEAGEIVERRSHIPSRLAPEIDACVMQVRQQGGEQPKRKVTLKLALRAGGEPRRDDRNQKIQSYNHIDVPKVAYLYAPVERDAADVAEAFSYRVAPVKDKIDGVGHAPEQPREQNPAEPMAEKGRRVSLHRQDEVAGDHHKKRHTDAREAVEPGKKAAVLVDDAQVRPDVVVLARVLQQHKKDRCYPNQIQRHIAPQLDGIFHIH